MAMDKLSARFNVEAPEHANAVLVKGMKQSETMRVALHLGLQQLKTLSPAKRAAFVKEIDKDLRDGVNAQAREQFEKISK